MYKETGGNKQHRGPFCLQTNNGHVCMWGCVCACVCVCDGSLLSLESDPDERNVLKSYVNAQFGGMNSNVVRCWGGYKFSVATSSSPACLQNDTGHGIHGGQKRTIASSKSTSLVCSNSLTKALCGSTKAWLINRD